MQKLRAYIKFVGVIAMSLGIASPLYAESAPVYDVDSMPQQYDSAAGDQQDVPPPPPGQEGSGGAYVPIQSQSQQPAFQAESASSTPVPRGSIEQRMRRVEQQVNNMQNSESSAKIDSLQEQVQSLRGQVETLTHDLQQLQAQQKSMYVDFDKRLTEKGVSAAPAVNGKDKQAATESVTVTPDDGNPGLTPSAKSNRQTAANADKASVKPDTTTKVADKTDNQPNVAEEQQIYQEAYNYIKAKKYNDAVTALQGMLKKYPTGQFAANAHYWLGELYGLMNKHDLALKEFATVIDKFPDSPRVSDAQLKVGLLYAAQSQWRDAKSAFKSVINHYPGTASARLASEQLKQIKQAGH